MTLGLQRVRVRFRSFCSLSSRFCRDSLALAASGMPLILVVTPRSRRSRLALADQVPVGVVIMMHVMTRIILAAGCPVGDGDSSPTSGLRVGVITVQVALRSKLKDQSKLLNGWPLASTQTTTLACLVELVRVSTLSISHCWTHCPARLQYVSQYCVRIVTKHFSEDVVCEQF